MWSHVSKNKCIKLLGKKYRVQGGHNSVLQFYFSQSKSSQMNRKWLKHIFCFQWQPTPLCSRFMRRSGPPGFWARPGYLAFSLASSAFTGLAFFSWESCRDDAKTDKTIHPQKTRPVFCGCSFFFFTALSDASLQGLRLE